MLNVITLNINEFCQKTINHIDSVAFYFLFSISMYPDLYNTIFFILYNSISSVIYNEIHIKSDKICNIDKNIITYCFYL